MKPEPITPTECPRDAELVELLERGLDAPAAARLARHLAGCDACRALVRELREGDADLASALAGVLGETLGRRTSIGRYRVIALIGSGGMGEVYAAYDPELDRRVALKLLHTAQGSEGARRRLLREARALGKLSHPNVVQVYDAGEHEGDVFVAMELVEGQAFDAWCRSVPPPGWRAVLAAYLDAARGLSAAHDKGLVHRDVKPSNILRGADGRVRVADFGLAGAVDGPSMDAGGSGSARPAGAAGDDTPDVDATWPADPRAARTERLTATGAILGTPIYMAPELHDGGRATPASDQYSLCTALYEGLYGELPFQGEAARLDPSRTRTRESTTVGAAGDPLLGLRAIVDRKREGVPAEPPAATPVPTWVHEALARGLSPRPEDRYPSLPALIAALSEDPTSDASHAPGRARETPRPPPGPADPIGRVPRPLTALVGRADELREILARVSAARLVTLTGAGGVGKSRLAIQVAADLQGTFPDGAWFVELAPLADPELVLPTVASLLGVHEAPGRQLFELLVTSLRSRRLFLVLDNCEHVVDAVSHLAERLLHACAGLHILATSRQSLGLTGEVAWRVPSLVAADAVALFQERAGQAGDPDTVAQICQRLDGIPLAIELAAARTRVLSVAQIAARLDDRFRLLTDGSRSALPRHRTLKAAVDWGYQLLSEEEQALLRRLSVFAGGCTLEAAEAVAGRDVLDPLGNLVDKSLVVFSGRYRLLETVRQYAAERLAERGETEDARARHLDFFLRLAEAAEPHIFGGDSGQGWVDRLEEENDNVRAAFDFCQQPRPGEPAVEQQRAEAALRLAAAVHWFWFARVQLREGQSTILAALRRKELTSPLVQARALAAAGAGAMWVGDYAAMSALAAESLAVARRTGDPAASAYALCIQGAAGINLGEAASVCPSLAEAVALARSQGSSTRLVFALYWLGTALQAGGDRRAAREALEEGLTLARRHQNRPGIGHTLFRLGELAESAGDLDEARRNYLESLRTLEVSIDRWGLAQVLDALGRLAVLAGRWARGACLLAAVDALCELTGAQILANERRLDALAAARRALGEPAFAEAWAQGRAMRLDEALAHARAT